MPLLDAALAFALTMLVVASVTTEVVRFGQWIFQHRHRVLRKMLDEFFASRIQLALETVQGGEAGAVTSPRPDRATLWDRDALEGLTDIPVSDVVGRLRDCEWGREMETALGERYEPLLGEIRRRYEELERRFTANFRLTSRVSTTAVALIVALAFNVDALFIAETYLGSEASREKVIARSAVLQARAQSMLAETGGGQDSSAAEEAEKIEKRIEELEALGLPIGWGAGGEGAKKTVGPLRPGQRGGMRWWLGVLLAGLAAGLGAPFWFDAVRKLSALARRDGPSDRDDDAATA